MKFLHAKRLRVLCYVTLLLLGCHANRSPLFYGGRVSNPHGRTITAIDYGYRNDKLEFVIFRSDEVQFSTQVNYEFTAAGLPRNAWTICTLTLTNGNIVDVLAQKESKVYTIASGAFSSEPITFSKADLEVFLNEGNGEFTSKNLKAFLSGRSAH